MFNFTINTLTFNTMENVNPVLFQGGKVAVPMDASENKLLTRIAEEYYITCDAQAQSGKTAWIGIQPDPTVKGRWQVSYFILYAIIPLVDRQYVLNPRKESHDILFTTEKKTSSSLSNTFLS